MKEFLTDVSVRNNIIDGDCSGDSSFADVGGSWARFEVLLSDGGLALEGSTVVEGIVAVEGEEVCLPAGEALKSSL